MRLTKALRSRFKSGRLITKHLKAYYHASGVWDQNPPGKIGIQVCKTVGFFLKIGPLQLVIHIVQNRRSGEQKSHWDKTNELLELMGLQQHVNEPTLESGHTLDLIITRQCDSLLTNISVTDCLLSDHSTLICDLILDKPPLPKKKISFRKTKVVDVNLLCPDPDYTEGG